MANILVVDDETLIRDLISSILESNGYLASVAKDGAEALKLCASQKFDLIVTDISMPNVDGFDFIIELNKHNSTTPIIAMSGGNSEMLASVTLQSTSILGVHSTLKKPFTKDSFLDAVRSALENYKIN